MEGMFFDGWTGLLRTILAGALAYIALVLLLRISGKRTLSQWNAFDFIVTIALGSILATIILSKDVPLIDGVAAFTVLILLQLAVTWLSVRSPFLRKLVKNEPSLLLYRGQYLESVMRRERVTKSEILAALRNQGIGSVERVDAVVLETDGRFSVIHELEPADSTLEDVGAYDPGRGDSA